LTIDHLVSSTFVTVVFGNVNIESVIGQTKNILTL
jgi:hypothetical protein